MMDIYLVQVVQQQTFHLNVEADDPKQAILNAHDQQGEVVLELPPEIITSASKVIGPR